MTRSLNRLPILKSFVQDII